MKKHAVVFSGPKRENVLGLLRKHRDHDEYDGFESVAELNKQINLQKLSFARIVIMSKSATSKDLETLAEKVGSTTEIVLIVNEGTDPKVEKRFNSIFQTGKHGSIQVAQAGMSFFTQTVFDLPVAQLKKDFPSEKGTAKTEKKGLWGRRKKDEEPLPQTNSQAEEPWEITQSANTDYREDTSTGLLFEDSEPTRKSVLHKEKHQPASLPEQLEPVTPQTVSVPEPKNAVEPETETEAESNWFLPYSKGSLNLFLTVGDPVITSLVVNTASQETDPLIIEVGKTRLLNNLSLNELKQCHDNNRLTFVNKTSTHPTVITRGYTQPLQPADIYEILGEGTYQNYGTTFIIANLKDLGELASLNLIPTIVLGEGELWETAQTLESLNLSKETATLLQEATWITLDGAQTIKDFQQKHVPLILDWPSRLESL